jgi:hypothetical protein
MGTDQDRQPRVRQPGEGSGKLEMPDDRLGRQVGMGTGQDRQPRQTGEEPYKRGRQDDRQA